MPLVCRGLSWRQRCDREDCASWFREPLWLSRWRPRRRRRRSSRTCCPPSTARSGLIVDSEARLPTGETHSAHFNSSFQQSFGPFNSALATQLAAVPLPAPASGFTYTYDSALGVFNRSTSSYGPILTERAETSAATTLRSSFNYQRFSFDRMEA